ncbi:hypothetical protein VWZ88_01245 [Phaeobacter sp. JH20_36]|uniref:hypothetical protein n=1 Tax=unclassified Phaeobacter TaxID=2621772 RepID=UPI003A8B29E5
MSYASVRKELRRLRENFAQDVFDYLIATGRSEKGRSYFGVLAAKNPNLIARLEEGNLPGLDVMVRVWDYMDDHPAPAPEGSATATDDICPQCGQALPK